MGKREEYNSCMVPYMSGGGPERKQRFCIGAKLCSGKASTKEEADRLCAEAAASPKPPKAARARKCKVDIHELAACIIKTIDGEPTLTNLSTSLSSCLGQKPGPTTRENFIKQCFKDNTEGDGLQYDIKEAQRLRSFCTKEWKAREGVA